MKNIILAIDEIQDLEEVLALVKRVGHLVYAVKIHNLYDKYGPTVVDKIRDAGAERVWVDYKIYDIPNTGKLRGADINADILSVHASGGVKMMEEIVKSSKEIFAVTMLTSFSALDIQNIYNGTLEDVVVRLAKLAKDAGVSGVVCSPQEIKLIKSVPGLKGLKIIAPGVRSLGVDANDQKRVATPKEAMESGADFLVMGRQIINAENPVKEIEKIYQEIAG